MQSRKTTNRRQFLRLSALGAAGALLAACAGQPAATPTSAPKAVEPTKPAATATTAAAAATPTIAAKPTAAAASTKPSYTVPTFALKIGFIGPLTGDVKTFGESTKNGFDMAVGEANGAGGQITFTYSDDKNDPTEAVNAVSKMVTQDQVKAIVGSVTSKTTIPASDTANSSKILLVTSTATNPKVTVADGKRKEYAFRACFIDPFQGTVMARFALDTLKSKTAAVLFDNSNDYTKGLSEFFRAAYEKGGGKVVAYESYGVNDVDFSSLLTKVQAANPDFLFLPDYYNKVNLIAKQAREKNIKAVLGGGDGWDSSELDTKAVDGGYFSNHYSPEDTRPIVQNWVKKYQAKYNSVPDALATLCYDATNLVLAAAGIAGVADPAKMKDALAGIKDFEAVSGTINFDKDGNPVKPAVIIQVTGGKQKFVTSVNP